MFVTEKHHCYWCKESIDIYIDGTIHDTNGWIHGNCYKAKQVTQRLNPEPISLSFKGMEMRNKNKFILTFKE